MPYTAVNRNFIPLRKADFSFAQELALLASSERAQTPSSLVLKSCSFFIANLLLFKKFKN